jgi:hypothetical protein
MTESVKPYHTLDISGMYHPILGAALNGALLMSLDLKTELSIRIFSSGFFDMDKIQTLINRFKSGVPKLELTEEEVMLIYSCHYVQALFTLDKEYFFSWYLRNDTDEDGIKDSEDFRKYMEDSQKAMVKVIENSTLWNEKLETRKQQLISRIRQLEI